MAFWEGITPKDMIMFSNTHATSSWVLSIFLGAHCLNPEHESKPPKKTHPQFDQRNVDVIQGEDLLDKALAVSQE